MPRGQKSTVVNLRCVNCNFTVDTRHLNKRKTPKPTWKKYCPHCNGMVDLKIKDEVK